MVTDDPSSKEENQEKKRFFIAVADRAVKGTLGAFYHYSVQYWRCDEDVSINEEISVADLSSRYPIATKINYYGLKVHSMSCG